MFIKRTKLVKILGVSLLLLSSLLLVACSTTSSTEEPPPGNEEGLNIAASFSILGDLIDNIVGERGSVGYIVPIGAEPHEYDPTSSDFRLVSDADVFYINGLELEGWLEGLISNVTDTPIVTVSEGITTIPIAGEDQDDPHAWLDVQNVIVYVENIVEDLIERDPAGKEHYKSNAEAYLEELVEFDAWIKEQVEQVPAENRVLIISENAFKYFGEAYGFRTEGIWELNSHEEGTPQQIARLVDLIVDEEVPALFLETTVDPRYMETVANDSDVAIAGEVYTDAVGEAGSGAETYIEMMRHNVNVFVEGLK